MKLSINFDANQRHHSALLTKRLFCIKYPVKQNKAKQTKSKKPKTKKKKKKKTKKLFKLNYGQLFYY